MGEPEMQAPVVALALDVCGAHFGPVALRIANVLQARGPLPFSELWTEANRDSVDTSVTLPPLSPEEVHAALLVLLTHRVVGTQLVPRRPAADLSVRGRGRGRGRGGRTAGAPKDITRAKKGPVLYELRVWRLVLRLRYPSFLLRVQELFGEEGVAVAEALAVHGMLSPGDIVKVAMGSAGEEGDALDRKKVETAFGGMVDRRYITPCEPLELPETHRAAPRHDALAQKRAADALEGAPARKRDGRGAAVSSDAAGVDGSGGDGEGAADRSVGRGATLSGFSNELHCLFTDSFLMDERNDAVVRLAQETVSDTAGHVVHALLDIASKRARSMALPGDALLTRSALQGVLDSGDELAAMETLPAVSAKEMLGWLQSNGHTVNWASVRKSLAQLLDAKRPLVERISDGADGGKFVFDFKSAVGTLHYHALTEIVHHKHGIKAARIVRLLWEKKYLEEKTVAHICKMEQKAARSLLFYLNREGAVVMTELPHQAERHPGRTTYMWSVNVAHMLQKALVETCTAILNLRLRRRHEDGSDTDAAADPESTAAQKKQEALDRLDATATALGETMSLFGDW